MLFPRARLAVSACLFLAWLGFLLWLVLQNRHMIVLSRPQLLAAPLCVVADISDKDGRASSQIQVQRVVWSEGPAPGDKIEVKSLAGLGMKDGYDGPGRYILALTPLGSSEGRYELVPVPSFPMRELRIYPLTRETERQLEEIQRLRGK